MNKLKQLDQLILEVLRAQGIELQEEKTPKGLGSDTGEQKQIAIKLPKFRITEKWGTPGNQDRAIVEKFFSKIEGSTIAARVDTLNKFISECDEDSCIQAQKIPKVLSNLVTLDVLASIIHEFGASPAGFLFEAFLASLVGGTQIVPQASISTEDIIDKDGVPVSIKLIKDDAYVHGSWAELKAAWGVNPKKKQSGWGLKLDPETGKRIPEPEKELSEIAQEQREIPDKERLKKIQNYIIQRRTDGASYPEIARDINSYTNLATPKGGQWHPSTVQRLERKSFDVFFSKLLPTEEPSPDPSPEVAQPDEDTIPSSDVGNMVYLVVNKIKGENNSVDLKWYKFPVTEKLMASLLAVEKSGQRNHPSFGFAESGKKFIIKKDYYKQSKFEIATLNLGSRDKIVEIASRYAETLGRTMFEIYELVDLLSGSINEYFLGDKDMGLQASQEADVLSAKIIQDFTEMS